MAENKKLAATFKSMDTEEWLDIHFTRPLGLLWANFFNAFGVHPNVVTILSIFLGLAAGIMFYFEGLTYSLIGIGLLVWANLYDSCDGQLARMTGKKTRWGRILDGFAGDVWFFAIYAAICLRLMPVWGIWIWLLCAFAGFVCHGKQCQLADYYRNIHLFFLKGESGSELDNSAKLTQEFQSLSWQKDGAWKLFSFFLSQLHQVARVYDAGLPTFPLGLEATLSVGFASTIARRLSRRQPAFDEMGQHPHLQHPGHSALHRHPCGATLDIPCV